MIVRVGSAPRRAGLTTEAFLAHWRTAHAGAAGSMPGLRSYVQLHPVLVDGVHALGHPGFDACSELEFDSVEAMDAAFASPVYREEVRADEAVLVDKTRFNLLLARREVLSGERTTAGVRLLTFLRRHPAVPADELFSALTGAYAEQVRDAVVCHEVLRPLEVRRAGREQQACDGLDTLVFADEAAASSWLRSEASVEAALLLAGLTFGTVRLLARAVVVVGEQPPAAASPTPADAPEARP